MLDKIRLLGFITKLVFGLFLVLFGVHMIVDPGHVTLYETGLFVVSTLLYWIAVKKD
jgi:hypothetical protein